MEWNLYILVGFIIASLFFVAASFALYWAYRNGQLKDFDKGAESIFDDEEPLGEQTDHFPGKQPGGDPTAKPSIEQK